MSEVITHTTPTFDLFVIGICIIGATVFLKLFGFFDLPKENHDKEDQS